MTENFDKILERVDALAEKLGTSVDYLWPIYVERAAIEGVSRAIVCGCLIVPFLVFFVFCCRGARMVYLTKRPENGDFWENHIGPWAFGLLVSLIGMIISGGWMIGGIIQAMTPEIDALKMLTSALGM